MPSPASEAVHQLRAFPRVRSLSAQDHELFTSMAHAGVEQQGPGYTITLHTDREEVTYTWDGANWIEVTPRC